jgi:hypothetical protein
MEYLRCAQLAGKGTWLGLGWNYLDEKSGRNAMEHFGATHTELVCPIH